MKSSAAEEPVQDTSSDEEYWRSQRHPPADGALVRGTLRLPCSPSLIETRRLIDWDRCLYYGW
jgi:hypothetical protein